VRTDFRIKNTPNFHDFARYSRNVNIAVSRRMRTSQDLKEPEIHCDNGKSAILVDEHCCDSDRAQCCSHVPIAFSGIFRSAMGFDFAVSNILHERVISPEEEIRSSRFLDDWSFQVQISITMVVGRSLFSHLSYGISSMVRCRTGARSRTQPCC